MKNGKASDPDGIPAKVWKRPHWETSLFVGVWLFVKAKENKEHIKNIWFDWQELNRVM